MDISSITTEVVENLHIVHQGQQKPLVSIIPQQHLYEDTITIHETERQLPIQDRPKGTIISKDLPHQPTETLDVVVLQTTNLLEGDAANEANARINVQQQLAIEVLESIPDEAIAPIIETPQKIAKSKERYLEHEAVEILSQQSQTQEGQLRGIIIPPQHNATSSLKLNEEILISKIQPLDTQEYLPAFSMDTTKNANLNIVTSTYLTVIETNTDELADKFYPELFVATETAKPNYNTLHEYTTEVPNVTEQEQHLSDHTRGIHQQAKLDVTPANYMVQQTQEAIENILSFNNAEVKQEQANVEIVENISTDNSEQMVMHGEIRLPDMKLMSMQASNTVNALSVASILQETVNETEIDTPPDKKKSIKANVSISYPNLITEQTQVTSMESLEPLITPKQYEQSATVAMKQAFAKNVEVTTPYESTLTNDEIAPILQTVDFTVAETPGLTTKTATTANTGKLQQITLTFNTHITNYITYRQYTTLKNTRHENKTKNHQNRDS